MDDHGFAADGDERDGSADGSSFIITRNITRSSGQPIFSAAGSGAARRNAAFQHYSHTRHFSPGRFQRYPHHHGPGG